MTDLNDLKQAAKIVENEAGEPVVQIPISTWEAYVSESEAARPQHERIKEVLDQIRQETDEETSQWWEEFAEFLSEYRVHFGV